MSISDMICLSKHADFPDLFPRNPQYLCGFLGFSLFYLFKYIVIIKECCFRKIEKTVLRTR